MYAAILTVALVIGQVWHDRSGWEKPREEVAMAAKTTAWTRTVDGDWDVAGNWSNGVPVNGADTYDVIFDPEQASGPPTVNLNQDGDTVNAILFRRGWRHGIGSSGSPLRIKIDSASAPVSGDFFRGLQIAGDGDYYFQTGTGGSANVIVDGPARGQTYLYGTIRNLLIRGGSVEVTAAATIENKVYQFGNGSYLKLAAGATLDDLVLIVRGGRCLIYGAMASGSVVHVTAGTVSCYGDVRTNFYVWGGLLKMLQQDTLFVSNYFALGGVIDFLGSAHTPILSSWIIGSDGHINWHSDFWQNPGATGSLTVDLRERNP